MEHIFDALAETRDPLPANPTQEQVADWYNRSLQPKQAATIAPATPEVKQVQQPAIPPARLVKGFVLFGGVLGVGYIAVQAVVALATAVISFISANGMVIGGAACICALIYGAFAGGGSANIEPHNPPPQYNPTTTFTGTQVPGGGIQVNVTNIIQNNNKS
jgi:hypothetical protein